jgi:hypothetical protein
LHIALAGQLPLIWLVLGRFLLKISTPVIRSVARPPSRSELGLRRGVADERGPWSSSSPTELEAFGGGGKNDCSSGHDLDGRRDYIVSVFKDNTGHGGVNESKRNPRPLPHI